MVFDYGSDRSPVQLHVHNSSQALLKHKGNI